MARFGDMALTLRPIGQRIYLHREALFILNDWSHKDFSNDYDNLASEHKAVLGDQIGLMLEIVLSLLPVGLMQTYQSVSVGYWSARSSEFMQTELMQTLRWMRMIGDTIFALGAIAFVYFALNLMWQRPAKKPAIIPTKIPAAAEIV